MELPSEDLEQGAENQDLVGLLVMSIYGTRYPAANFQIEAILALQNVGFRGGRYIISTCYNPGRERKCSVHGEHFIPTGDGRDMEWMQKESESRFDIKTKHVALQTNQETKVKVLNGVIRLTDYGWEYGADRRHGELIVHGA